MKNNYLIVDKTLIKCLIHLTTNQRKAQMTTKQKNLPTVSVADKRLLKSYVAQSYLFKKYSTLKKDTKDIVAGIFDKVNLNIIILDNKSFVQQINKTQRRFDSTAFIDYIKKSADSELIDLIGKFYKTIDTVEFKPFNADYDTAIKKDLGGFDAK